MFPLRQKQSSFFLLFFISIIMVSVATGYCGSREEKIIIVQGQNLTDGGEYNEAIQLLRDGKAKFPQNDAIISYLGEALFLKGDLSSAEDELREALILNSQNTTAKKYIEKIREIGEAQESQAWAKFKEVFWDKIGDFIIFVIGVFLGTFLTAIVDNSMRKKSAKQVKKEIALFKFSNSKEHNDNSLFLFFTFVEEMILNQQKLEAVNNVREFYVKFTDEMNNQSDEIKRQFLKDFTGNENMEIDEVCRDIIIKYIDDEGAEKSALKIFSRISKHHFSA